MKPCPFCGSTDVLVEWTAAIEFDGQSHYGCWVECKHCSATGPDAETVTSNPGPAVAAWNNRK